MIKKNILVVDDAENIRYLLKTVLELEEYNITTAESGKEAIKKIKIKKPDLMILDLMMPEMDGWEVCRKLKEELKIEIPTLVLTARVDEKSKKLSEKIYKVKGYMVKPFLNKELVKKVKKLLE